jgi:hypothetical protein
MTALQHIYARSANKDQFILIQTDTFPNKSLLFGSNARKFCELVYEPKAVKAGEGFGRVVVDEFGVPSIVGEAGEYTFNWYVIDKTDGSKYGPYTCTMTTTAFADTTAPTVGITTTGAQLDLRPALVGTVDDATARVVVTINSKDYAASNDGVGGWAIPIDTIDAITISNTTVTVRAIDDYDNVGSASTTIYYDGSEYAFVSDFDVSAQGYTDQQAVATLVSSVGSSTLTSSNVSYQPTYNAEDASLLFTASPADRLFSATVEAFKEIFVVITDTNSVNFAIMFQARSSTNMGRELIANNNLTTWKFNTTNIPGRLNNQKQIIHLRYSTGNAHISVNGGAETTAPDAALTTADLSKIYIHDGNFSGTSMKLHEIATTGALNSAQRAAVIADLKTKWGIA